MQALLILLSFVAAEDRVSVVLESAKEPPADRQEIFTDDTYRFYSLNFGSKGGRVPGFLVQSKKSGEWRRIAKISTAGAQFGRSPSFEESRAAGIADLQVGWDFRYLKKQDYVELPLRSSGSIMFPERIAWDRERHEYVAYFNEQLKVPASVTKLVFRGDDLAKAFAP